jgi:hypothetical protein
MSPRAAASSRCHLAYLGGALPTELPRQGLAENLIWPGQRGAIESPSERSSAISEGHLWTAAVS